MSVLLLFFVTWCVSAKKEKKPKKKKEKKAKEPKEGEQRENLCPNVPYNPKKYKLLNKI